VDEHAAVWVPDSEAGTCMHCKKVQFTLVNRRHHCRKCGVVCCNACSSKRFLLPAQSSKPLRVCMTCYNELSSQSADQSYNKESLAMEAGKLMKRRIFSLRRKMERGSILVCQLVE